MGKLSPVELPTVVCREERRMKKEYIAWFNVPKSGKLHGQSTMPGKELIRCKDCLFSTCVEEKDDWWECEHDHRVNHGDGFCNWSERRTDG